MGHVKQNVGADEVKNPGQIPFFQMQHGTDRKVRHRSAPLTAPIEELTRSSHLNRPAWNVQLIAVGEPYASTAPKDGGDPLSSTYAPANFGS